MDNHVRVTWPLREPHWMDFQEDFVLFGDEEFLSVWEGAESDLWDSAGSDTSPGPWPKIDGQGRCWAVGEMPGLLAPSVGICRRDEGGESVLIIWELVAAHRQFVLPKELNVALSELGRAEVDTSLDIDRRTMRMFPSREEGSQVIARNELPVFRFKGGFSKLEVYRLHLQEAGYSAEFLLHCISGGFSHCEWRMVPDSGSQPT